MGFSYWRHAAGSILFLVQSLRFLSFPGETAKLLTRTRNRKLWRQRATERDVGWRLSYHCETGSLREKKTYELISYQIYMKITINYWEIFGMLETIIRSTCRHYYVNVILFLLPMWGHASSGCWVLENKPIKEFLKARCLKLTLCVCVCVSVLSPLVIV